MITELSSHQEQLLEEVGREWMERLISPPLADGEILRDGLLRLCKMAGLTPTSVVVVNGPLEAQAAFLELALKKHGNASPERFLERTLLKKVWSPAVGQLCSAVHPTVVEVVGTRLGDHFRSLREQLKWTLRCYLLNTHLGAGLAVDAFTAAILDFFARLGVIQSPAWQEWHKVLHSGLWCSLLHGDYAVAVAAPLKLEVQDQSLHCTTGPAISWRDGVRSYQIKGTLVSELFFEDPQKAPIRDTFQAVDSLVKKDLISVLGLPRFLSATKTRVLDQDLDRSNMPRRLIQLDVGWGERWCVVEVCCPSTRELHYLWVPPNMQRCSQAVAWTFGFEADAYLPSAEA